MKTFRLLCLLALCVFGVANTASAQALSDAVNRFEQLSIIDRATDYRAIYKVDSVDMDAQTLHLSLRAATLGAMSANALLTLHYEFRNEGIILLHSAKQGLLFHFFWTHVPEIGVAGELQGRYLNDRSGPAAALLTVKAGIAEPISFEEVKPILKFDKSFSYFGEVENYDAAAITLSFCEEIEGGKALYVVYKSSNSEETGPLNLALTLWDNGSFSARLFTLEPNATIMIEGTYSLSSGKEILFFDVLTAWEKIDSSGILRPIDDATFKLGSY